MDLAKRRRRRRRQQDHPPLSAKLQFDDRIKDEVGLLSEDLFQHLFPKYISRNIVRYVAITSWLPESIIKSDNVSWTVIPVRVAPEQDEAAHSSIRVPSNSTAFQSFIRHSKYASPSKFGFKKDVPIEIRITDVIPVGLDTIYVTIQVDALRKNYESQLQFGGGFLPPSKQRSLKPKSSKVDERDMEISLRKALKTALASQLIHSGDQIHLPLPAHPITHVAAPPARISACEPVSQGLVLHSTRIVVIKSTDKKLTNRRNQRIISPRIIEEDEDTGNEQFYSAAESPAHALSQDDDASSINDVSDTQSVMNLDNDDLSDDPEDVISLSAPTLPPQTSGILSGFAGATPRAGGRYSGNIGTPGSIHSSYTNSTARAGANNGRVFKTQGLLNIIPQDLLHPKPHVEDDDGALIYVDTSSLVKISCFSGDWVNIEEASDPQNHGISLASWTTYDFDDTKEIKKHRPVRIFALPEARRPVSKPLPRMPNLGFGFGSSSNTPTVYVPPVLLANLSNASHVRISPLSTQDQQGLAGSASKKSKFNSSLSPPVASEVKILKILSPLSQDLQLQSIIFSELKNYFEGKKRIVKSGDLIAIAFDQKLGRAFYSPGNDSVSEDLATLVRNHQTKPNTVAWFKVSTVISEVSGQDESIDWGGAAHVASSITKLVQKANESSRLPSTLDNTWQYYYGLKKKPVSNSFRLVDAVYSSSISESYVSEMRKRIRELISVATSTQAIKYGLEPTAILLISTQRQIGKMTTAIRACEDLGIHSDSIEAYGISNNGTQGEAEEFVKQRAQRLLSCGPENTALLFRHIDALSGDRMISTLKDIFKESRIIIATTVNVDKMSEEMRALFTYELEFSAPDEGERAGILRDIVNNQGVRLGPDVELGSVALKTAALVAGDLLNVVKRAITAKDRRLKQIADTAANYSHEPITEKDVELAGGSSVMSLNKLDFDSAVDRARKNFADAIGAPKIPNVGWDDVGGMAHIKEAVIETIQLPLTRPELFAKGMKKRSGILFYGPPGTGKTLLAKAIATEFSLNFFSVKGPELLNMYIGESEANVRRVFQRARDARPCVVFFDELDSVAPKRGNQGDSGGVMDRIVSQLLAELDGMSTGEDGGSGVFVIGATNRPDLLDQALLRPGRFDKMLYLGISDTHDKQLKILEALTRKFALSPTCSLKRVADQLPFTYTGADLYALCSDAMLKAITRQCRMVDEKVAAHNSALKPGQNTLTTAQFFDHYATDADTSVTVTEDDFHAAHKELVPSVSAEEFGHYERVRKTFEGDSTAPKQEGNGTAQSRQNAPQQSSNGERHKISLSGGAGGRGSGSPSASQSSNTLKSPLKPLSPTGSRHVDHQRQDGQKNQNDRSTFFFDNNTYDDEEEYVTRTDHYGNGFKSSNKTTYKNSQTSKGKGNPTFGSDTNGDDDMYS